MDEVKYIYLSASLAAIVRLYPSARMELINRQNVENGESSCQFMC